MKAESVCMVQMCNKQIRAKQYVVLFVQLHSVRANRQNSLELSGCKGQFEQEDLQDSYCMTIVSTLCEVES